MSLSVAPTHGSVSNNVAAPFLATTAIKLLSIIGLLMMPFQVSILMDFYELSAQKSGVLATVETTCLGFGVLLVAFNLIRLDLKKMALLGFSLALLANLLMLLRNEYEWLFACRAIAGLGYGLANATASRLIASLFKETEKVAGYLYALIYLITTALYYLSPTLIQWSGSAGFYLLIAGILTLLFPLILLLPSVTSKEESRSFELALLLQRGLPVFFAIEIILMMGLGASWSFSERFAKSIELGADKIGLYYALSSASQFLGALLAAWVAVRFGKLVPLIACLLPWGAICIILSHAETEAAFAFGILAYQFMLAFFIPYLLGIGARLDPSGRIAAVIIGVQIFSFGAGSSLGGFINDHFGLNHIGTVAAFACFLAVAVLPFVVRNFDTQNMHHLESRNM
ncbi:MFS transporter [Pseudoteredinibacter isoporae]|uniref:Putative MFS family arabinose efflux permease n=1 Tax=Pseudoteredinibacter isoporae TaxID=570281 RepID=A0A7X0JRX1_9GAMM|nr:MFS transporter [Pseudoteredinibacter isoporae]MBB6520226.1 putative MFS family arabinose efflux permease [Pseudoteredinibacter isoporae]NHO85798.1 MFS transporter [Pseudoteredinibacter isoporae]NIB25750.1 MFS transporter [Pseudoteredinibacter isoporae]